jgi:hypothetical protein
MARERSAGLKILPTAVTGICDAGTMPTDTAAQTEIRLQFRDLTKACCDAFISVLSERKCLRFIARHSGWLCGAA